MIAASKSKLGQREARTERARKTVKKAQNRYLHNNSEIIKSKDSTNSYLDTLKQLTSPK